MDTFKTGISSKKRHVLYRRAAWLAVFTIIYNLAEGAVSVFFGMEDETIALFGFGLDSFVEVISGAGILHMVLRLSGSSNGFQGGPDNAGLADRFESTALKITGSAFYLLAAGLLLTTALALYGGHSPETTFWGIVVSLVSIVTMWALILMKERVGRALGSAAILADAACTRACLYLSLVLLASSVGYEITGVGGLDAVGAGIIAVLAYREGRESFDKSRGGGCGCEGSCASEPEGE
ncbi:MAG: cation transporter [Thermodesulfovibrionales bacterium]|nr:cation transporter [Thermodesulfovibrionales bacterium]